MKAALIPPVPQLKTFGQGKFHLLLSHLLGDNRYVLHYRKQRQQGAYLILDNSAHENGAGDKALILAAQAGAMKTQEVVVPDVLFDSEGTIKRALDAHEVWFEGDDSTMRDPDMRLMYVPQGRTKVEWAMCLRELVRIHLYSAKIHDLNRTFVLGVSKDYEEWGGGLRALIDEYVLPLKDQLHMQNVTMQCHLLGWGRDLWELGVIARAHPWIRSVDSAKPFVYAMNGIQLETDTLPPPYPKRPEDYFAKRIHSKHYGIARKNIEVFQQLAKGQV